MSVLQTCCTTTFYSELFSFISDRWSRALKRHKDVARVWDESTGTWDDYVFEETLHRCLPANVSYFRDPQDRFFLSPLLIRLPDKRSLYIWHLPNWWQYEFCEFCYKPSSYVLSEVLGTLFLFFSISVMEWWVLSQTLGQLSSLCRDYIDYKKNWLSNKSSAQSILRDDSFHPTIHVTSDKSSGLSHSMNLVSQYMYHLLSNTWIILKPWSMENWTTYYVSPWSWSLL